MAICRVFQNPDGSVSIMRPNPTLRQDGESDGAFIVRIADLNRANEEAVARANGVPPSPALPFIDVDESEIPTDRQNRQNWRIKDGKIVSE